MVRVYGESAWLGSPCFADGFVGCEGLEPFGGVVGVEERKRSLVTLWAAG